MNKIKYTPWQQWAQNYTANHCEFEGNLIDKEDADRYAHAAWEECKKRCLEILMCYESSYMSPDAPPMQMSPDIEFIEMDAIDKIGEL